MGPLDNLIRNPELEAFLESSTWTVVQRGQLNPHRNGQLHMSTKRQC